MRKRLFVSIPASWALPASSVPSPYRSARGGAIAARQTVEEVNLRCPLLKCSLPHPRKKKKESEELYALKSIDTHRLDSVVFLKRMQLKDAVR